MFIDTLCTVWVCAPGVLHRTLSFRPSQNTAVQLAAFGPTSASFSRLLLSRALCVVDLAMASPPDAIEKADSTVDAFLGPTSQASTASNTMFDKTDRCFFRAGSCGSKSESVSVDGGLSDTLRLSHCVMVMAEPEPNEPPVDLEPEPDEPAAEPEPDEPSLDLESGPDERAAEPEPHEPAAEPGPDEPAAEPRPDEPAAEPEPHEPPVDLWQGSDKPAAVRRADLPVARMPAAAPSPGRSATWVALP